MITFSGNIVPSGRGTFILYLDDRVLWSGTGEFFVETHISNGWHQIILECTIDDFSSADHVPLINVQIKDFKVNGSDKWIVDAGVQGITPPIPFSTLQGHCFSNSVRPYLNTENRIGIDSFIILNFLINDEEIVDHYYSRPTDQNLILCTRKLDPTEPVTEEEFFVKDELRFDPIDENIILGSLRLLWSDTYKKYVHRVLMHDHIVYMHDPDDKSTWGEKWWGVYLESTPWGFDELIPFNSEEDLDDIFFDYCKSDETSYVQAQSGKFVKVNFWPFTHVFGAYAYKSLPPEIFAFIHRRV